MHNSIDDLQDELLGFELLVDPETKENYEYVAIESLKFELCATFNTATDSRIESKVDPRDLLIYSWEHEEGRVCFE